MDGLMALSRALVGVTVRALNALGTDITLTQYRTLIVLASRGAQRIADLAAELGVQPSTTTRLCDRLVARGLVRRQPGESDRRVVWVVLTDAGKELVGHAMGKRCELLTTLIAQIEVRDGEAFARVATALAVAAGEPPEPQWWERWRSSTSIDPAARE